MLCDFSTCSVIIILVRAWKEIIFFVSLFINNYWLIFIFEFWNAISVCITFLGPVSTLYHVCVALHMSWTLVDGCVCTVVISTVSSVCNYCAAIYIIMLSMSISGIPNKACLFLGTKMNLHILYIIYSIFTLLVPNNCVIVLCFNWMFLFFGCCQLFFCCPGNHYLYKCKALWNHHFPSLLYHVLLY